MRVRAVWNDVVLAESERTTRVEGDHCFPPEDVAVDLLRSSATSSHSP